MKHLPDKIEADPVIEVYKRDIDTTLLDESLKLSVDERLDNLMRLQEFAEELRRAGREARGDKLSISHTAPD